MSSSKGKDKDPSSIHPGLKSLDYLNPKIGSMYFRFNVGEGLRYTSTDAFLTWKKLPSTMAANENKPFYIFLHDYGSSSRIFNKIVSKIDNYCLAIDFKGWGRSDDTKDGKSRAYSIRQMKNEIPRIVNLLGGEKFILVGHGMGAKVAQLYAIQQPPKNLLGLVLLAPAPLSPWRLPVGTMANYRAAYKTGGNLERFIKKTLASSRIDETDHRNLVEDGMKETPLAKEAWLTYGMDEDFSQGARIEVPVVVRYGKQDKIINGDDVLQEITGKVDLCLYMAGEGFGHVLPLEDDELQDVLEIFSDTAEDLKRKSEKPMVATVKSVYSKSGFLYSRANASSYIGMGHDQVGGPHFELWTQITN